MPDGRTPSGYVYMGKFRFLDMDVPLTLGWMYYHPEHDAMMLKPNKSALIPCLQRHEGEAEMRAFCRPFPDIAFDLPFIDEWEVELEKSSKNKKVTGLVYTAQDERGQTRYDWVIDVPLLLRLLDKQFWHVHNPHREQKETE